MLGEKENFNWFMNRKSLVISQTGWIVSLIFVKLDNVFSDFRLSKR
jgi:hypothetical protein